MKKVLSLLVIIGIATAFVACGPSKADLEAKAKKTQDSIRIADSLTQVQAALAAKEQAKQDSIAKVQAKEDSIKKAEETKKLGKKPAANKTAAKKVVKPDTKVTAKPTTVKAAKK